MRHILEIIVAAILFVMYYVISNSGYSEVDALAVVVIIGFAVMQGDRYTDRQGDENDNEQSLK